MAWLNINGWEIDVKNADESSVNVGDFGRAFDGSFFDSRRAQKKVHKFSTAPMVESDAETLFNLIRGLGETWSFDSATNEEYGSRGSGVVTGSSWSRSAAHPKWGAANISVLSGDYFECDYAISSEWTITHWKYNGTSWDAYSLTSAGDFFDNGVKNVGNDPTDWLDVTTTAKFNGKDETGALADAEYDDVVILPYIASDNFLIAHAANTIAPKAGLPFLTADGDYFSTTSDNIKKVFGTSVSKKPLMSNIGGSFNSVGRTVDFEVQE